VLYGHFSPDAGEIRPVRFRSPKDAGIGMVHQHFVLVETFTVLENLLLGCEGGALLRGAARSVREDLARFARTSTWRSIPTRSPGRSRSGCVSASRS
jgi:general nucleoside transport system ATP-binding protein